jgi:signal transduction histidine kinase
MIHRSFAHDMKNCLGIVLGYANLLLDEMPADDPRRSDLDEIRKAGDAALARLAQFTDAAPGDDVE